MRRAENFLGEGACGWGQEPWSGRASWALNCVFVLSPEEAARGGVLPIAVPVSEDCPESGGSVHTWLFPCLHCELSGLVEQAVTMRLEIPPMILAGTVIDPPLEGFGVSNFRLRILIRIDREP